MGFEPKPEQINVVEHVLKKDNFFLLAPTAWGKSVPAQVIPYCFPGAGKNAIPIPFILGVFPTRSLVEDQKKRVLAMNSGAVVMTSDDFGCLGWKAKFKEAQFGAVLSLLLLLSLSWWS